MRVDARNHFERSARLAPDGDDGVPVQLGILMLGRSGGREPVAAVAAAPAIEDGQPVRRRRG
jgi:hypothetical protein